MNKYCVNLIKTDVNGCDALAVYHIVTAHSFSEALIKVERKLTNKERILKVNEIKQLNRGDRFYGIL